MHRSRGIVNAECGMSNGRLDGRELRVTNYEGREPARRGSGAAERSGEENRRLSLRDSGLFCVIAGRRQSAIIEEVGAWPFDHAPGNRLQSPSRRGSGGYGLPLVGPNVAGDRGGERPATLLFIAIMAVTSFYAFWSPRARALRNCAIRSTSVARRSRGMSLIVIVTSARNGNG